jgi:hypothetical protein
VVKLLEEKKTILRKACSTFFGDKGPLVNDNNKKLFTKGTSAYIFLEFKLLTRDLEEFW